MEDASKNHKKIAQNIRDLVVNPFSRWCEAHESRIQESQDELQTKIKAHDRQQETVKRLRTNYFNKCRLLEDLEEENKLAFQDPETSPTRKQSILPIPEIKVHEEEEEEDYEIGDEVYQPEQVKKILAHMLTHIKMGETKVPILGTYLNTSSGADIVDYLQRHMGTTSVSYAERIGQDLITLGFLRLIGNVGSTFANSSKMFYQWRPKAFQLSGVPEKKPLGRTFTLPTSAGSDDGNSQVVGAVSEVLSGWGVLPNQRPNETPSERMRREAREADERYKAGVRKLDELRCDLEESIYLHLKFLERCELDRLKAIKTVILDFSGTISNVIPSLQSTVDKMMLFQETVQPLGDLRYLLENYRTGGFAPKVVVYENYYNKVDEQTFGVDLEARARADKKRVPIIVTTLLTYLDHHYPDLEGDEARRGVWLVEVPLSQTHKLRNKLNDGKPPSMDVFAEFDIPTVASLLKLYLLELPGKRSSTQDISVTTLLTLHRFSRLFSRLRNHPHHLHNPSNRKHGRSPHLGAAADPVPAAADQHRHPGCLHEPLHAPDRPDDRRRGIRVQAGDDPGAVHPPAAPGDIPDDGREALVPPDPRPVRPQGRHLLGTEAHVHPRPLRLGVGQQPVGSTRQPGRVVAGQPAARHLDGRVQPQGAHGRAHPGTARKGRVPQPRHQPGAFPARSP